MNRLRSVLFAPANRADLLAKLSRSGPDAAVMDIEDAVPGNAKAEARAVAREMTPELAATEMTVLARVNALASEFFTDDLTVLGPGIDAVVVPKIESVDDVAAIAAALASAGVTGDAARIFAGIETVAGVERANEILAAPEVVAAYFGAEDYIADLGGVRTPSNTEVLYARSRVGIAGRLGGTPVIDQIVADFGDHDRFRHEAAEARSLGYAGKLCIHPAQVTLANESFVPSPEEVARARALLAAYDDAVDAGSASIAFDGQMVDEPVARQARSIIERAGAQP